MICSVYLTETGGELVLPTGVAIGHRSLVPFYKQRHRPIDTRTCVLINQLARQYRELGYDQTPHHSDLSVRVQKKLAVQDVRLAVKGNKLPKYMRHNTHMT